MRRTLLLIVAVAGLSLGAPVITVVPAIGPSSVTAEIGIYNDNALIALQNGLDFVHFYGGLNSVYERVSGPIQANQMIDSYPGILSWLGEVNGAGHFQSEYGNNLYFGLIIDGRGSSFSLSQLVYADNLATYDPSLAGTTPFSFDGEVYDSRFLAYLDDGNTPGVLDGDDSKVALNALGSTPVNYLFYRGVPVFFQVLKGNTDQEALDNTIAAINANAPLNLTASYCLADTPGSTTCGAATGQATVGVGEIPEPSTYALMGLGLAALAYARRRMA